MNTEVKLEKRQKITAVSEELIRLEKEALEKGKMKRVKFLAVSKNIRNQKKKITGYDLQRLNLDESLPQKTYQQSSQPLSSLSSSSNTEQLKMSIEKNKSCQEKKHRPLKTTVWQMDTVNIGASRLFNSASRDFLG